MVRIYFIEYGILITVKKTQHYTSQRKDNQNAYCSNRRVHLITVDRVHLVGGFHHRNKGRVPDVSGRVRMAGCHVDYWWSVRDSHDNLGTVKSATVHPTELAQHYIPCPIIRIIT